MFPPAQRRHGGARRGVRHRRSRGSLGRASIQEIRITAIGIETMTQIDLLIVACGVLALLYGAYAGRSVLAASAGTDRMREIAGAVQEGARAYLNRQYTTVANGRHRDGRDPGLASRPPCRDWLCHRRHSFGCRRLYRHERVGARQCAHGGGGPHQRHESGARHRVQIGGHHRHAGGRARASRRVHLLFLLARQRHRDSQDSRRPGCAFLRRVADLDFRAIGRRHLHQGCRCRRRSRRQDRSRNSRGRSAQPGGDCG